MSETNESKGMASGIGETLKEIKQFIFKIIGIVLSVCIFLSNYPAIPFYAILAGMIAILKYMFIKLRKL